MYQSITAANKTIRPDVVAAVLFEKVRRLPSGYLALDKSVDGALAATLRRSEFSTARGSITCLYPGRGTARILVAGLGPKDSLDPSALRIAAAKVAQAAHAAGARRLSLVIKPGLESAKMAPAAAGRAIGDGLAAANFAFDQFKANDSNSSAKTKRSSLTVDIDPAMREGLKAGLRTGESVNLARTLAATPPNVANPAYLVKFCRRVARQQGMRCTVLDARRAAQLGMGGLVSVGAAGSTPPALICLEHRPSRQKSLSAAKHAKLRLGSGPILLVGKAITFDTGGYSLKPPAGMEGMKYDKCGGTAVIGAMHAIARLQLPVHVVGLIATAENMVSDKSYRPGDILKMYNGTTVEVTNTDAEGRLVLADALAYGCRKYKPAAIVDLATLTGGVVVALGKLCAGAFCEHEPWRTHLIKAGDQSGDRLWHLPLWEQYSALLKSQHADIVNSGPREAMPIQGAVFLSHFVDKHVPWAHLDIAGVSHLNQSNDQFSSGPTGFGVRLIVTAIESLG